MTDLSFYISEKKKESRQPTPISEEKLKAIFERLTEACDNLDMDEMEECGNELKNFSYPVDKENVMNRLYSAISGVDGDLCKVLMEEYQK